MPWRCRAIVIACRVKVLAKRGLRHVTPLNGSGWRRRLRPSPREWMPTVIYDSVRDL